MSPTVKYTLGRVLLFVAVLVVLWPVSMDILLKLMLAVIASAAMAFFLLGRWRNEVAEQLAGATQRRREQKERLRAALAGEDGDETAGGVQAAGDAATADSGQPGGDAGRADGPGSGAGPGEPARS